MKLPAIFASLRASASRLLAAVIGATLLTAAAPAAAQQTCTESNKCTLTVTPAAGQSKVYGNPEPDYVYTVSGYVDPDNEANTLLAEDKRSNPLTRQGATSRSDAANDAHLLELRSNVKNIFLRKAKRKLYRVVLGGGAANRRFSVTRRPINYTATGVDKVYDGTDAAPSDLGGGFADGDIIAVDEGEVGLSHSGKYQEAGGVAAAAAGANKTIGDFGASLTGSRRFHYRLESVTASGAITPRPLTLRNVVLTKSHDGNTGVSGATVSADIGNVVSGQTVALSLKSGATAAFDSAAQGSGKTVTGLGADDLEITVTGGHGADSYSLPTGDIAATGTIAAAASAAPSAPAGVTAAAGGAFGELDLSWTALNDNSVSGYLYRWSNDGDASDWESANGASGVEFSGDGDTASFTIGSLAAGVGYVVQIAAKNNEGDSPWSASTTAAAALSAPGAPGITAATAAVDAITVQWDAPGDTGGAALTGYKIRWAITPRSGDPVWLNANGAAGQDTAGGAGTRSETISDLVPRAPYMVQVAAVNAGGAGAFSASSSATPTARADDADIRSITVTVNTSVGDEVTLSPAFSRNITTYTARIPADVPGVVFAGVFSGNEIDDVDQDDFGVSKLSHSPYRFVTGRTDFDIGENTLKLVVTAADGSTTKTYTFNITRQVGPPLVAPAAPTLANGSAAGSLDVSWSAVAASGNGGSAITAYQVRWGKDPETGSVNWNGAGSGVQAGDATARAYTIEGLETGTAYQVQVAAVNGEGIGVWSASATETPSAAANNADITALTVSTAGGAPVSLDTQFVSSTTEYTADVATDVESVIFTATYVGSKLVVAGDPDNAPESGASSEAVALTVGVAKDITLVVTAADTSTTRTYTVTVTRAAGAPAKPAKPTTARSTTVSGSVDVAWTWSGADNNGAAVTAFHVQWKKTGDSNWLPNATGQEISDPSDRAYAVTGLDADARYHARVRAVNAVGNGEWSDNSEAAAASGRPNPPVSVVVSAVAGGLALQIPEFNLNTGGPPIAGYRFRWRTAATNGPDGTPNTADDVAAGAWQDASGANDQGHFVAVPAKRYNITGLTGGVRYDVQGARQNDAPSGNLSDWTKGQTLAPTRKAITIAPNTASKVYGAADPAVDYPQPNFLARHPTKAHVFTADPFDREPGENAGEYNYRLKDPLPWVTAGNPAGAYSVSLDGRSRFTISKKEVTYTSTAADKTYDGNVNAPSDLGGSFTGVVTATVNGVAIDDTAAGKLSLTGGRFQNKNAGENKAVTQFVLDGDSKDNYTLASGSSVTGDIAKLATTLTLNVNARVYDGTTNTGAVTAVFSPEIVGGDTVNVDVSSAVYADADAGTGKTINGVADAQITGGDKANYEITIESAGEVTKRPLRVSAGGSGNARPQTAALADHSLLTIGAAAGEGLVSPDTAATVLSGAIALGDESGSAPRFTSPLTIGTLAASGNYELIFTAGEFVRSSLQTLVVTPAETTRVFGGSDPTFTWTVAPQSGSAFITGDSASTQFFTAGQTVVQRAAGNDAGRYAFSLADPLPTASGIDAKYLFVIAPGAEYTITPKPLTATAITLTKEYDGAATITGATIGGGVLSGLEGSDAATLALKSDAVGNYADADAGESKTLTGVDSADFEISATDPAKAGNYAVPSSLSVSGEITAKEVTVAAVTLTKEYDGDATLGASIIKTGTGEITGEAGSESLVLTPTAGDYDAAGAGARSVSGADFDLASPDSSAKPENYALPASLSVDGEITAKEVAVADVTVTKTFDNTTAMTGVVVTGGAVTGAVGSQTFTLQLAAANDGVFDSANVGTGINVSGADFELAAPAGDTASDPANYALPEVTVAGVIEPKELTFSGVATLRKSYDGTNAAEATGANAVEVVGGVIAGAVGANTFRLALASGHDITYPQNDAGGALTFTNADAADFALQSAGAGDPANYRLSGEISARGEIARREVTVAAVTLTKPYDGTAVVGASVALGGGELGNVIDGETLVLEVIAGLGGYPQSGVGADLQMRGAQFRLRDGAGGKAANYKLPSEVDASGVIEAREVTVSTPRVVKEFDNTTLFGNTALAAGSGVITGAVGADALALAPTAGVYATGEVGSNIAVSNLEWELRVAPNGSGDTNNYALPESLPESLATGEITRKLLTLTQGDTVPTKVYDGGTAPPALTAMISAVGLVTGASDVGFDSSTYNSKDVLRARYLTVALSGTDAENYRLDPRVAGVPATITPKTVNVTITGFTGPTTKVYDGTAAAPVGFAFTGASLRESDVVEADRGKVALGAGGVVVAGALQLPSKNSPGDLIYPVLTGEEASNYRPIGGSLVANAPSALFLRGCQPDCITPRPLRVTADDAAGLDSARLPTSDLTYTVQSGVADEGLVAGETAEEILSGELAYGTASGGIIRIVQGTLAVVGGNYSLEFTPGEFHPSGRLDLDVSGAADFEEGAVIMRYLFGLRGDALTAGLSTLSLSAAELESKIAKLVSDGVLDVDGNAGTTARDGAIIARYLLGVTEAESLVAKFGAAATAADVLAAVRAILP